jgi:hypothetical protein
MTTAPGHPEHPEHDKHDEKHRLTAVQGLAALSLDALSSVAYGPEAILVVLVAAGTAGLRYSLPITGAIIILLAALVVSYRQVIAAFPGGGGAYAVAKAHLGTRASLVAAASPPTPRSAACRCWPPCWPRTTSCRTCSGCAPTGRCTATG